MSPEEAVEKIEEAFDESFKKVVFDTSVAALREDIVKIFYKSLMGLELQSDGYLVRDEKKWAIHEGVEVDGDNLNIRFKWTKESRSCVVKLGARGIINAKKIGSNGEEVWGVDSDG